MAHYPDLNWLAPRREENESDNESDYASGYTPSEFQRSDTGSGGDSEDETDYEIDSEPYDFDESDCESDYASGYTPSEFASEEEDDHNSATSPPSFDDDGESKISDTISNNEEQNHADSKLEDLFDTPSNPTTKSQRKRRASSSPSVSLTTPATPLHGHARKKARIHSPTEKSANEVSPRAESDDEDEESHDKENVERPKEEEEAGFPENHSYEAIQNSQQKSTTHADSVADKNISSIIDSVRNYTTPKPSPSHRQQPSLFANASRDAVDLPNNLDSHLTAYRREIEINSLVLARYSLAQACTEAENIFAPKKPFQSDDPNFNILNGIYSRPEIVLCLVRWLDVDSLETLYATDRHFHWLMNSHFTTFMKAHLRTHAPHALEAFPFRWYASLTIADPARRLLAAANQNAPALNAHAQPPHPPQPIRRVPGFAYAKMAAHRHRVAIDIIQLLKERSLAVPAGALATLLKVWFTMDVAQNGRRIGLVHHSGYWSGPELWRAAHVFMKLEMACADPLESAGARALPRLFLGLRHLTQLRNLLRGDYCWWDVAMRKVWYDYVPGPQNRAMPIFGIPPHLVGRGCMEGWGTGNSRLLRVDELVLMEMLRRGMFFDGQRDLMELVMYGFWPGFDWLQENWQKIQIKKSVRRTFNSLKSIQQVYQRKQREEAGRLTRVACCRPFVEDMD